VIPANYPTWQFNYSNIGKLQAPINLEQYMLEQLEKRDLKLMPITLAHVAFIRNMSRFHGDPFDHLLIAQASIEQMPLLTNEAVLFSQYGIQTIW
jgi:PIN domain nuclease of toxin-antitoxin system